MTLLETLTIPAAAQTPLSKSLSMHTGNSKFSVYFDPAVSASKAKTICEDAEESYERAIDLEVSSFLQPVLLAVPGQATQNVLVHHFDRLSHALEGYDAGKDADFDIFPYGFLYVSENDPTRDEVTAILVGCEKERRKWHVGTCYASISKLAFHAKDMIMGEVFFPDVQRAISGRADEDERNGSNSEDDSQPTFALFSTGMEPALQALSQMDANDDGKFELVCDPENSRFLMSRERMVELFPTNCTDWPCHKSLFVCIDNDRPMEQGVLVMRMDWDQKTHDRSELELRRIGRESKIVEQRCKMEEAYALLVEMSETSDLRR